MPPKKPKPPTPTYITPDGHRRLIEELKHLHTVERPKVVQEVADAAAQGDRSENASYIYGKKRLREIDRRLRYLSRCVEAAQVVDPKEQRGDRIFFGATVVLENEDGDEVTYQIVGPDDVMTPGRITYRSPVGAALIGRALDDEVMVDTPKGSRTLTVLDIRYE